LTAAPPESSPVVDRSSLGERSKERRALTWLAIAAFLTIAWIAHPFGTGLLLGVLLAFALESAYAWLVQKTGRPLLAALVTVIASAVVITGAVVGFASLFVTRAVALSTAAREQLQQGGALSNSIDAVTGWLGRFGLSPASIAKRLEEGAGEIASQSATLAGSFATGTFSVLLGLFFAMLAMYLVLRRWPRMVAATVELSPLASAHTELLLEEFRRVGRMTISGTVLTGLAQGTLAAIGFMITGVPQAMFFGTATALASLLPGVGTLLIWVPAGFYLLATGHLGMAITEWIWGTIVVVGFSDYVIRPRLVGDESMPALLVFLSLFGGIEVLGLSGLIVGPVIVALAVAVLRLYARERNGHTRTQGAAIKAASPAVLRDANTGKQ
jgi:predicted PurR-regulated permease PerM